MGSKKKPEAPASRPTPIYKPWAKSSADDQSQAVNLANSTGTKAAVFSGMKSANGWTDLTLLTKSEFLKARSAWLNRPASEG